ncbi:MULTISPECIES: aminoglycoside 6'-N-acetyltransferase [Pseudomonas]|uniref:aminoglycoside 6'-N-acetyltransferase n=1 Tax=Pseudomonas TaxID=286 RepID=UPI00029ADD5D|nr:MULTISPECIES: aminoglycoside 6'-N-acetyltransferase [Pseudomonas]MBS7599954.1 GNAT family N-acetyltransferase [Pseudomonas sp. RC2C2]MCP6695601.1 GNAT family N-acetyltransferase [Pseudomonas donghuensis]PJY94336.1 N-acetyltransferase [Pseudomonas donghuensis]QHF27523.1 aminoglycoside 6'-acetyltransferase [Pseudomonas sp. R32]UVL30831.1 GNAT family N-acetyltransferase [Pseudomonas donghuensis]
MIETCTDVQQDDWLVLRQALWPQCPLEEHRQSVREIIEQPQRLVAFLARDRAGRALGFAEASIRSDYVNGSNSSPVAFLEGVFVAPQARGQGVAGHLIAAVEQWGASLGCSELASDAALDNHSSHAMHAALGFSETERVVYFLKPLAKG